MKKFFIMCSLLLATALGVAAQGKISIQDINSGVFAAKKVGGMKAMPDGETYSRISDDGTKIIACYYRCCLLVFFFIGMRIYHTYSGVVRYLRSSDLLRVLYAQMIGFALILIVRLFFSKDYIIASTGLKNYATAFFLSVAGQWSIRLLMKAIYESSFNNGIKRAFIFGVQQGAEVIASTIQASPSKQYSIVGFVSPNGDLADKYMFGVKVRRVGPNLIEHMKKAHATVIIVSPLQAETFRNNTELVEELIKNKIHILMLSEAEVWTPEKGIKQDIQNSV